MNKKKLSEFTAYIPQIEELSEILFLSAIKKGSLAEVATVKTGVVDNKPLVAFDGIGIIGKESKGCGQSFDKINIEGVEKRWSLKEWAVNKSICYKELEDTIVDFVKDSGITIEDLTESDYVKEILLPLIEKSMIEMMWRYAWFNDTAAATVSEGGVITDGMDLEYFTLNDGLFKRIFAIMAEKPAQHVAIAANGAETITKQRGELYTKGVPTNIMDKMIAAKSPKLSGKNKVSFKMTEAFADALAWDLKQCNSGDLVFTETREGVKIAKYGGYEVLVVPMWDYLIAKFEDNGTTLNKPYRVILSSKDDLLVGTGSEDSLAQFKYGYDEKAGDNWFRAKDTGVTLTFEDDLIFAAY